MLLWAHTLQSTLHSIIDTQALMLEVQTYQINLALQERRDNVACMERHQDIQEQLDEYQEWRLHIIVASRMGWAQSARYIREFPLEETYGQ